MKRILTIFAAVLLTTTIFAQAPEKMSYQAVVRDANNDLVTDTQVGMQISILQGAVDGAPVYVETQTPTTNANGLVSVEIGGGTVESGDFTAIDWSAGPYFIKTETDPAGGTDYTITGTSQLLSVPYALHAKTAESSYWNKTGNYIYFPSGNVGIMSQPTSVNLQLGKPYANFFTHSFQDIDTTKDRTLFMSGLYDAGSYSKSVLYLGGNYVNAGQVTGRLTFVSGAWENAAIQGVEGDNTDWSGELVFLTRNAENPSLTERMRIDQNGYVGIGTSTPATNLHILNSSGGAGLKIESTDDTRIYLTSNRSLVDDYWMGLDAGNNKFIIANIDKTFYPFVASGNFVGINTLTPKAPLHINDFMKLEPRSSAPANPEEGMVYYDSTDHKLKVYDGTSWTNLN